MAKRKGKEQATGQGDEQIGRRGLGADGMYGKELGERERKWRKERWGWAGGTYGMLVLGLPRRWQA